MYAIRSYYGYSKFNSLVGSGSYRSLSLGRELGESFRFQVQAGTQDLKSSLTRQSGSRWINADADWFLGLHYFLGAGFTFYRGNVQNYNQWFLNLGYRY